jgi:hypothetical protein
MGSKPTNTFRMVLVCMNRIVLCSQGRPPFHLLRLLLVLVLVLLLLLIKLLHNIMYIYNVFLFFPASERGHPLLNPPRPRKLQPARWRRQGAPHAVGRLAATFARQCGFLVEQRQVGAFQKITVFLCFFFSRREIRNRCTGLGEALSNFSVFSMVCVFSFHAWMHAYAVLAFV